MGVSLATVGFYSSFRILALDQFSNEVVNEFSIFGVRVVSPVGLPIFGNSFRVAPNMYQLNYLAFTKAGDREELANRISRHASPVSEGMNFAPCQGVLKGGELYTNILSVTNHHRQRESDEAVAILQQLFSGHPTDAFPAVGELQPL